MERKPTQAFLALEQFQIENNVTLTFHEQMIFFEGFRAGRRMAQAECDHTIAQLIQMGVIKKEEQTE